ncbi:MAG: hypothetical protein ACXW1D_00470 [Halobacteriota archaeon]
MDATMCEAVDKDGRICKLRNDCYRYTGPANTHRQSYFVVAPFYVIVEVRKANDEIAHKCDEYVSNT